MVAFQDHIEIIYYQMLELENRLDKKLEYIETAEKTLEKSVLELNRILKEIQKKEN